MKIIDILNNGKINVSCEVFPPKLGSELVGAREVVRKIALLKPSFMSVTYGAGGGTSEHTVSIADELQNVNNVPALAHLTCCAADRESVSAYLAKLRSHNIENVLALRGDLAPGCAPKDFLHASDLMLEIKAHGDFCIGGACYPEGHPESETIFDDIDYLKLKVDCGCEFFTTQMFFDNNIFYTYMYKCLRHDVNVPVVAGIMPVTNIKQVKRIRNLSGARLPHRLSAICDRFAYDEKAFYQAGIAYATEQIINLISNGVKNIHIYTMNKPEIAADIFGNLSEIIGKKSGRGVLS